MRKLFIVVTILANIVLVNLQSVETTWESSDTTHWAEEHTTTEDDLIMTTSNDEINLATTTETIDTTYSDNVDNTETQETYFNTAGTDTFENVTTSEPSQYSTSETSEYSTSETPQYSTSETSEYTTSETSEYTTSDTPQYSTSETSEYSTSETSEYTTSDTPQYTTSETSQYTTSETPQYTTSETSQYPTSETSEYTTSETPQYTTSETSQYTTSETPQYTTSDTPQYTTSDTPQYTTSDTPQYTTSEPSQYTTSETPQYTTSDTPQYTTSDTPQYTTSETSQYPTSETLQYTTSETSQYPTSETSQYPTSETPQHPTSETLQYTTSETSQYTTSEPSQYTTSETSQYTTSETSQYTTSETSQYTTTEAPQYTTTEITQNATTEAPQYTTTEITQNATTEAPQYTTTEITQNATTEAPQYTTTEITQNATTEAPQYTTTEITQNATTEAPQYTTTEITQNATTNTFQNISTTSQPEDMTTIEIHQQMNTTETSQDITTIGTSQDVMMSSGVTTEPPAATTSSPEILLNTTVVSSTTSTADDSTTSASTTSTSTTTTTTTTQKTSTSTTTKLPDTKDDKQRELYQWGSSAGDGVLRRNDYSYYWYGMTSQPVYFTGGVPFGSDKHTVAYIHSSGVITFGSESWIWWPQLETSYGRQQNILAAFWFEQNYKQSGSVYYHVYERKDVNDMSPYHTSILDRATKEVNEIYGAEQFKALTVLVVTWDAVEPYSWYTWICEYYQYYQNQWWWQQYYLLYYSNYCLYQYKETNTFQAVYVTDGQVAYAIVTYKYGQMTWRNEMYRNIVVGYATYDQIKDYGVTNTDLTTKMDTIVWNTGRYGTWIEKVGQIVNPDSRCLNFFVENLPLIMNSTHQKLANALFDCPCSLDRLGRQWWSYSWDLIPGTDRTYRACYAIGMNAKQRLQKLIGNPLNKLCCYLYTYPISWQWQEWEEAYRSASYISYRDPKAGHLLLNDPWYWWGNGRKSREEDFNPHRLCCEESSSLSVMCALFNIVRPDYGCSRDAEFITGAALGDPHIITLDGHSYTCNGLGEYILVTIQEQLFMLQGRTRQVLNSQGIKTSATVFVAFAAQEGNNCTFQVELNDTGNGMVIISCGADVTLDFYQKDNYTSTQGDNDISVTRQDKNNRTSVVASFPSGISIEVYVGLENLQFSANVLKIFQGKCKGLLGNFNGDPNDDFVLPDGTVPSETNTDRQIFYNFCQEWEVTTSNTIFIYPEGESALTYQNSSFEPMFMEEQDPAALAKAEEFCGKENDGCIFDLIATNNTAFSAITNNSVTETNSVRTSQANSLPVLSLDLSQLNSKQQWEVTDGENSMIVFHATDADVNDSITYLLKGSSPNVYINSSGVVTYKPNSATSVVIGVQAKDTKGGVSLIIYLDIVVCPACSGHGVCNKNRTRDLEKEGGRFVLYVCSCRPAYTGEDCERELDACATFPCSRGQTCTDLTAAEQGDNETGHICGSCPTGFMQQDGACADVNECIVNGTGSVCQKNAFCTNNVGSYLCTCDLGFRQDPLNTSQCQDVDECAERTHKCDQICQNLDGNYSCSCFDGNTLNSDGKTCKTVNSAGCPACKHVCVVKNGTASCNCRTGFKLDGDTNCVDIDECTSANKPCSQACQNNDGSYLCSCYRGYKLDEDGVSCTECNPGYYGDNCASMCVCSGRGSCNNIHGCQCKPEWTGVSCNQDVDECQTDISACPSDQICRNTIGNFSCSCPPGYIMNNGRCEDINECLDVLNNNCSLSVEDCINNKGSYSCVCIQGYARNTAGVCEDIDECSNNIHNCQQICENIPGKYNCYCYYGFKLDSNRASCVKNNPDVCAGVIDLKCKQICTVNWTTHVPYCSCNSGYGLSGKENCVDIDECKFDYLNLCEYKEGCINKVDGYNCSCLPGSMLDNDERSCVVCSGGKWGPECSNDCACSTGASDCDPKKGCLCKSGYTGTYCERDIDECSLGLLTCQTGETCVNTPGSVFCQCLPGYTRTGSSCQDIDECTSVNTNNCDQVCENYQGGYSCSCNVGYQFNTVNKTCHDINECTLQLDGCEQICENSNGGYRCSCYEGLKLLSDGVSCIVASECVTKTCEDKCAIVQGQEKCFCSKGKKVDSSDDSRCEDEDMCANSPCSNSSGCEETVNGTSFICTCPDGQKLAADGFTCVDCTEGTFGVGCSQRCVCDSASTQSCSKINGTCTCKTGWTSSDCSIDVDECMASSNPCSSSQKCDNTPGSYICKCSPGYYFINNNCQECASGTYGIGCINQCTCDSTHSTCDNVSGICICSNGWNGTNCDTDVNECLQDNNCTAAQRQHWICFNTPGSYTCDCDSGYVLDTASTVCVDLDECAADYSNECDQNCTNTIGGYRCSCNQGYQLGSDGHKCDDINECSKSPGVCQQLCSNNDGGYHCSCRDGYEIQVDDNSLCYEAVGMNIEITIPMNVNNKNLREQMGKDYLELKQIVIPALRYIFSIHLLGFIDCKVTQMRKGSLIVDATASIDRNINQIAPSDMVEAIILLFENGLTINGTHYNVDVKVGNVFVNHTTDKCLILNAIEPCKDEQHCVKDSTTGKVSCKGQPEDSVNVPLAVGLGVGLPLGIALIVAMSAAYFYKQKLKAEKRVHHREDQYNENDRASTPETMSNLTLGEGGTLKTSGKMADKLSLYP